ncbi:MAG: hypothetical protein WKF84_20700 [Pyrinomonadaceae bacterium]
MGEQCQGGRVAIPISGGLDSRTTVAPLNALGLTPQFDQLWSYSYGYSKDSVETDIARRVAIAGNIPFQAFTVEPYLFKHLDVIADSIEGFQDIIQCRQATVIDDKEFYADYLIAAHWGDVWMDTMGLVSEQEEEQRVFNNDRIAQHALKKLLKKGRDWLQKNISNAHLGEGSGDELMLETTRKELASLKHLDCPDFRVKAFKTDSWSHRWTMTSLLYVPTRCLSRVSPFTTPD